MKKILSIITLLVITSVGFAQQDMTQLEKAPDGTYKLNGAPFTGKVFKKYDSGQIALMGELKDGKKTGTWHIWWPNGQKKMEAPYENGKKEGLAYFWHTNGVKAKEIMYRDNFAIDQRLWDENGKELPPPKFDSWR